MWSSRQMKNQFKTLLSIVILFTSHELLASKFCTEAMGSLLRAPLKPQYEKNVAKFPSKLSTKHLDLPLLPPSGKLLKELSKNPEKELTYFITPDDRIFFVWGNYELDGDYKWSADLLMSDSTPVTFPIKASGKFSFEKTAQETKGTFITQRTYGAELSQNEINQFSKEIEDILKNDSKLSKTLRLKKPLSTAKVIKCSEAFQTNNSKKFVSAKLITSITLLTGGIIIQNPQRFDALLTQLGLEEKDPERDYDGDMLLTDYLTTGVNSLYQGIAGYHISAKGLQFLQSRGMSRLGSSLLARGGVSLSSIGMQTLLYSTLTDNNAKGVGLYNIGYSTFSIVKSHYFDDFLVHKLPEIVSDACLKNPALKIILGQRSIRLGEGLASTWLYLTGRDLIVGE